jgi:hypothetical protein
MAITLNQARKYAWAADALYDKTRLELDALRGLAPEGSVGCMGFNTVADVLNHLQLREQQITELRDEIKAFQTTDAVSDAVLEIANRLGLKA